MILIRIFVYISIKLRVLGVAGPRQRKVSADQYGKRRLPEPCRFANRRHQGAVPAVPASLSLTVGLVLSIQVLTCRLHLVFVCCLDAALQGELSDLTPLDRKWF